MASTSSLISSEEFNLFHTIDRKIYAYLVTELWRDPLESMLIVALWLWLERRGFNHVIKTILTLPEALINELADEALCCLKCISNTSKSESSNESENNQIPLTHSLVGKKLSLSFFEENQVLARRGIAKVVTEVCVRALADIMQQAMGRRQAEIHHHSLLAGGLALLGIEFDDDDDDDISRRLRRQVMKEELKVEVEVEVEEEKGVVVAPEDRTMFVTFSKGYPVAEWEVREFFNRIFGDYCIDSLYMQQVKQPEDQPLFARIVFHSPSIIRLILGGLNKAKFTINGKHVWMRKFVAKKPNTPPSPPPPTAAPAAVSDK